MGHSNLIQIPILLFRIQTSGSCLTDVTEEVSGGSKAPFGLCVVKKNSKPSYRREEAIWDPLIKGSQLYHWALDQHCNGR